MQKHDRLIITGDSHERTRQSPAVMDKNGKILYDKESKTKRWLEHFFEVLNRENPSNPESEMKIELPDEIEEIDTSELTIVDKMFGILH